MTKSSGFKYCSDFLICENSETVSIEVCQLTKGFLLIFVEVEFILKSYWKMIKA